VVYHFAVNTILQSTAWLSAVFFLLTSTLYEWWGRHIFVLLLVPFVV